MRERANEQGQAQGWSRQEGQAREEIGTPIFDELVLGREYLFMNETPPAVQAINELAEDETCQICKATQAEHGNVRHTFTPPGVPVDTSQFARKRPKQVAEGDDARHIPQMPQMSFQAAPFDPVLRQALIDKGIITVEDLEAAQRKIVMLTNQITQQSPPPKYRGGVE